MTDKNTIEEIRKYCMNLILKHSAAKKRWWSYYKKDEQVDVIESGVAVEILAIIEGKEQ